MTTGAGAEDRPTAPRGRAVVADDDHDVRVLLRTWLERYGGFEVAAQASDGVEAVEAVSRNQPDLVVLDLAMPRMDGLEAATAIRRASPRTRIVVHSAFSADRMAARVIEAGADAYVEKATGRAVFLEVVEGVLAAPPGAAPVGRVGAAGGPSFPAAGDPAPLDALLLDALEVGVLVVDAGTRVRSASFHATLALGVPTSRLVGSSLAEILAGARSEGPDGGRVEPDPVSAALASGLPRSGAVLGLDRAGGSTAWLSFSVRPVRGGPGRPATGAVVVVTDVTEDRSLRAALREAEARAELETADLVEPAVVASPVGALLLDGAGRLVLANPVADRLLGGTFLLCEGPPTRELLWADTLGAVRDEDLPLRAACQGVPFDNVELFVPHEQGASGGTYLKLSGRPVADRHGAPSGAVVSVLDDTAAKEAQRELTAVHEELQRSNAELVDFASTASHDLMQPLMKIQGFAEMLQELGLEDARARDYVDRIVVGSQRMRSFIRELLSFSRVTTGPRALETVELQPLVGEVVDLFEAQVVEKDAQIEVGPLPTVVADPTQLSHVFQNLVGNALTYVAEGVSPVIEVSAERVEGAWCITVADNGIGISPADRDRAFGMFQRLAADDYDGTGIGLAVCAKVVERHGGRIWIEGEPGQGTRVRFTLPDPSAAGPAV